MALFSGVGNHFPTTNYEGDPKLREDSKATPHACTAESSSELGRFLNCKFQFKTLTTASLKISTQKNWITLNTGWANTEQTNQCREIDELPSHRNLVKKAMR